MGDIGTHAKITAHVIAEASRSVPPTQIPRGDYTYLELGNFLTDVSQFRDPTSFHAGRERALAEARAQSSLVDSFGGPEWAIDLFGQRAGPVHGALPEFLRLLMQAFTHELFDDDGLPRLSGRQPPGRGLPPDRVDALLTSRFTQYFPHEHLDFPPFRDLTDLNKNPMFERQNRGLIGYLEWYLRYVSEELSKLEAEWVSARARGLASEQRQDFLARLGHLLHPIEDYFFHSNLLELYQWKRVRAAHPSADPAVPADLRKLVDSSLAGSLLSPTSVPLRRRLHRRLRYPIFTSQTQLSRTASDDGTELIFTGGFGPTDISHTLGGALEAMELKVSKLPPQHDPRTAPLILIRLLFNQGLRKYMVARNTSTVMWKAHRQQLQAGAYRTAIKTWRSKGMLCPHAATALERAFDHDLAFTNRHKGFSFDFPGPGSVFIIMLDQMQRERDRAAAAGRRLDGTVASMYDKASDNGCSVEAVGTHSLMSKDSSDKEPMRPEAVSFAKHASASVAKLLLDRVYGSEPLARGLDWERILTFFVRGVPSSPTWESELLQRLHQGSLNSQPHVTDVAQQPNFGLLDLGSAPGSLAARRAGKTRADLEAYYRSFER